MVILPENETNNTGNAEDVEDRLEKGTRECAIWLVMRRLMAVEYLSRYVQADWSIQIYYSKKHLHVNFAEASVGRGAHDIVLPCLRM